MMIDRFKEWQSFFNKMAWFHIGMSAFCIILSIFQSESYEVWIVGSVILSALYGIADVIVKIAIHFDERLNRD